MAKETSHQPTRVRALFLSDIHLGTRACKSDLLLDFLRKYEAEYIYLVGDIIDGWRLRKSWYRPQSHNDIVQRLLRKVRRGARAYYIPGNHDEWLRDYTELQFHGIAVVDDFVHKTADGRRFLVIHGDEQFYDVLYHIPWWRLGRQLYSLAVSCNSYLNKIRRKGGLCYWPLSLSVKLRFRNVVEFIDEFEKTIAAEARRRGLDGVICGHIHHAVIRDLQTVAI